MNKIILILKNRIITPFCHFFKIYLFFKDSLKKDTKGIIIATKSRFQILQIKKFKNINKNDNTYFKSLIIKEFKLKNDKYINLHLFSINYT